MINAEKNERHNKGSITMKDDAMLLLLLLEPLRDAVTCAFEKTGGNRRHPKAGNSYRFARGSSSYKPKLKTVACVLRDYCIRPVVIACA